jgi:calcyphosin
MDDDGNKKLNFGEFERGITEYGLGLTKDEIRDMFTEMDLDGTGNINFNEFLIHLRPQLSQARLDAIDAAFAKMDKTGDGQITLEDLRGVYDASQHPQFLSGELTEDQVFRLFMDTFDTPGQGDGIITKNEFINYYAGVSASIDSDEYFVFMIKRCWRL